MPEMDARNGMLSALVNHFVHPSFRLDADTFFRGRILIASVLTFIGVCTAAYMAVLLTPFLARSVFWASLILPPAIVLFVVLLKLVQRRGVYLFASLANVLILFGMIVVGITVSGGPAVSPVVQLLVVPPLTAYFFGGLRWGGWAVWLTFFTLFLLVAGHFLEFPYLQTVSTPEQMAIARDIVSLLNLTVISVMAFIYEYTAAGLKRERDIERERYVQLAKTDPLTGLANRRHFDTQLQERVRYEQENGLMSCFALGCLDLDGFKPINDQFGHAVGDEVLVVIASRLRACLRGTDFVSRQGGDEFMLLFDRVGDQGDLAAMADRLLASIALPITTSAGTVGVTGSLGFALYPRDATDLQVLANAADAAMYEAKQQKGRWCLYTGQQMAGARVGGVASLQKTVPV